MSMPRVIKIVLVPVAAAAVALTAGFLFLQVMGYPAGEIFTTVFRQSFSDPYGFSHVLRYTSLLTLAGLAVALSFRAGLFNIGVEGQVVVGGLAVALAAHYLLGVVERDQLEAVPWFLLALGSVLITKFSMIVVMTSWAPETALSAPGIAPQMAPPTIAISTEPSASKNHGTASS